MCVFVYEPGRPIILRRGEWESAAEENPGVLMPTVFVVDDDRSVRESLGALLEAMGYRALLFSSGVDFLACEHVEEGDCLILDINLPDRNGLEIWSMLKQNGTRMPVVFITAQENLAHCARGLSDAVHAVLPKPVRDDVLLQTVASAVRGTSSAVSARN